MWENFTQTYNVYVPRVPRLFWMCDLNKILMEVATKILQILFYFLGKDLRNWFAELSVDMDKIQEITR
jgi:hypothetical protein